MDWAQVLVVILAVLFSAFLLLAILLAVLLVKVTRQIKAAASSAERAVAAIEGTVSGFSSAALPMKIVRMVMKHITKARMQRTERR